MSPFVTWTCFPQPQPHPIHGTQGASPSCCALFPQVSRPSKWSEAKVILTVFSIQLVPTTFDGLHKGPAACSLIHIHNCDSFTLPKIELPHFATFDRYSIWLCLILSRQIRHILHAGGSIILILSNSSFCLLTNFHFLL